MSTTRTRRPSKAKLAEIRAASDAAEAQSRAEWPLMSEANATFEPTTCATAHLACERVLRILERSPYEPLPNQEAIYELYRLASDAGPAFNRAALASTSISPDEVPF